MGSNRDVRRTASVALFLAAGVLLSGNSERRCSGSLRSPLRGERNLPKAKQTTLGLYVTAAQAYEMWKAAPDKVKVIDVRTPEEFAFVGHPAMALNIPLAFVTYQSKGGKFEYGEDEHGLRRPGPGDRAADRRPAAHVPFRRPRRDGR